MPFLLGYDVICDRADKLKKLEKAMRGKRTSETESEHSRSDRNSTEVKAPLNALPLAGPPERGILKKYPRGVREESDRRGQSPVAELTRQNGAGKSVEANSSHPETVVLMEKTVAMAVNDLQRAPLDDIDFIDENCQSDNGVDDGGNGDDDDASNCSCSCSEDDDEDDIDPGAIEAGRGSDLENLLGDGNENGTGSKLSSSVGCNVNRETQTEGEPDSPSKASDASSGADSIEGARSKIIKLKNINELLKQIDEQFNSVLRQTATPSEASSLHEQPAGELSPSSSDEIRCSETEADRGFPRDSFYQQTDSVTKHSSGGAQSPQ